MYFDISLVVLQRLSNLPSLLMKVSSIIDVYIHLIDSIFQNTSHGQPHIPTPDTPQFHHYLIFFVSSPSLSLSLSGILSNHLMGCLL
mmetsp:Transcript_36960/g.66486  ORF Transcript_36960/g.66486 Transcript_36960/m.66486 type:complete len:87 (+) Transcript_36960:44-304(+)